MDIKEELVESEDREECEEILWSDFVKEEFEIQEPEQLDIEKKTVGLEKDEEISGERKRNERKTSGVSYKCAICQKVFLQKSRLKSHMLFHSDERNFECAFCSKKFKSKSEIFPHLKIHVEKPRQCPHCKKLSKNSISLRQHIKQLCQSAPRLPEYFCNVCGEIFLTQFLHKRHLTIHQRKFECQTCHLVLSCKQTLNRHMKIHTGEKPHVCDICGRGFVQKTNLNSHRELHSSPDYPPMKCPYCSKMFERKQNFKKHIYKTHKGLPVQPNGSSLTCRVCKEVFLNLDELMVHVKVHKLSKSFECGICKRTFSIKGNLKRHIKELHKESNYE